MKSTSCRSVYPVVDQLQLGARCAVNAGGAMCAGGRGGAGGARMKKALRMMWCKDEEGFANDGA